MPSSTAAACKTIDQSASPRGRASQGQDDCRRPTALFLVAQAYLQKLSPTLHTYNSAHVSRLGAVRGIYVYIYIYISNNSIYYPYISSTPVVLHPGLCLCYCCIQHVIPLYRYITAAPLRIGHLLLTVPSTAITSIQRGKDALK